MRTQTHRLFFALWPSDNVRKRIKKQIQPLLNKHPAKKVPVNNWHITLAFLGNVTAEVKQCVQEQATQVRGKLFNLQLDELGYFKRARVAWLGCSATPEALQNLVEQLSDVLAPCEYQSEHNEFTPHMTLLRKANKDLGRQELEPINWSVNQFVLIESQTTDRGSIYKVINKWDLVTENY